MNPLPSAADKGDLKTVRNLMKAADPSQTDKDLALGRACCAGHFEVAQFLVENGADPNGQYQTKDGRFEYGPIILASCEFLNAEGVKFLLDCGANPNGNPPDSQHMQSCTPLEMVNSTYAKNEEGKRRCIDLLIAAGAHSDLV